MINGLIVSDNMEEWADKLNEGLKTCTFIRTKYSIRIVNSLFHITIQRYFNESCRGMCYNFAIVDKPLSFSLLRNILIPIVKAPIIYTSRYKEEEEKC